MTTTAPPKGAQTSTGLDRFFSISARGSNVTREIRGGVVTFVTMVYIVVLNPLIIGTAKDVNGHFLGGGSAPNLSAVAAVTALVAAVLTLLMAFVGRYPFALATGLGLNAFVAFQVASRMSWPAAMGIYTLPANGSQVATVAFDQTGTTRMGKFVLDHSFQLPNLVYVGVAILVGVLLSFVIV